MKKFDINKLRNLLLSDVKTINKYLLIMIILVILSCVGLSSYALFSYEIFSQNNIKVVFDDVKGPTCVIEGPDVSEISIESNATYTMNCIDSFGVSSSDLTSDNFTITGDITISNIAKEQIDNGYKYTITILSGTSDTTGNIKLNSNVIQDMNGNYNKESNVSSNIIVITFPSEPTEYVLIDTYTASETFTSSEDGWFQIEVFGASGNGGYTAGRYSSNSDGYYASYGSGGGGGGGGYACSHIKLKKGDTVVITPGAVGENSIVTINSSVVTYDIMQVTSGASGGDAVVSSATSCTAGAGGTGGIASGGNYMNSNGNNGTAGKSSSYSMGGSTKTGGAGGTPGYEGGNTGGQGAAIKWNGQTTFTRNITSGIVWNGSAGFIKIYRGNTNTTN